MDYYYPNTRVFINKLDIRDGEELLRVQRKAAAYLPAAKIRADSNSEITFNSKDSDLIPHKRLKVNFELVKDKIPAIEPIKICYDLKSCSMQDMACVGLSCSTLV